MNPAEIVEAVAIAWAGEHEWQAHSDVWRHDRLEEVGQILEAAAPLVAAPVWEDAYALGYADSKAGASPTRKNPYKKEPATAAKVDAALEHQLARTQLTPTVYVWCKCGLQFDAFGDRGAMNKLNDHIFRELNNKAP